VALIERWIGAERRAAPAIESSWESILRGSQEAAGLAVPSIEGSLAMPTVYACIRVLSETIASLPLVLYRRTAAGRERATEHPLYEVLHEQPNPEQTAMELRELIVSHVAGWGNAYVEIEWTQAGRVRALWPLRPDRMRILRRDGELAYEYSMPTGRTEILPWHRIMHVRGLGGNGVQGYSPLRMAMVAVALGMATEEFGARFFANGARPGAVLTHPGTLSDKAMANLKASWAGEHGGLEKSHRLRILEEGMKLEAIGVPPEEAQFLETRTFQAEEIARIYRMPPHKVGLLNKATFSNIEHQSIEFVTDTILPWLVRLEQVMQRDLLTAQERRTHYVEHVVDGLLRGDTQSRYQAYAVGRQWGWLSVNDIRQRENMEPVRDGDVYLQPLNMVAAGAPVANGAGRSALLPVFEDGARRVLRRGEADLRRAGAKREAPGYGERLTQELREALVDALTPAVVATGGDVARLEAFAQGWSPTLEVEGMEQGAGALALRVMQEVCNAGD
jgi:HK97 family phage portal protein